MVVAVFATLWMSATWLTTGAPPADTIEQMSWARSLEWGYFKHPPLTTWLYRATQYLIGPGVWPGNLLATLVNLGSMLILWQLLRQMRGATFDHHWRSLDSAKLAQALLPGLERALSRNRLVTIDGPGHRAGALALHLLVSLLAGSIDPHCAVPRASHTCLFEVSAT